MAAERAWWEYLLPNTYGQILHDATLGPVFESAYPAEPPATPPIIQPPPGWETGVVTESGATDAANAQIRAWQQKNRDAMTRAAAAGLPTESDIRPWLWAGAGVAAVLIARKVLQ